MTLVKNGASLDLQNDRGFTALLNASYNNYPSIVKYLVGMGADQNLKYKGKTALDWATERGSAEVVTILKNAAAAAKERLANQAAGHGLKTNAEVAAAAAAQAQLDAAAAQAKQDAAAAQARKDAVAAQYDAAQGSTALMEAARKGLTATMQAHLDADASIDQQDTDGFTALHFASYNNHPSAVTLLLAHNADPSIKHAFGDTALDIAKEEGHGEVIAILARPVKVSLLNPIVSQTRRAHRTIS